MRGAKLETYNDQVTTFSHENNPRVMTFPQSKQGCVQSFRFELVNNVEVYTTFSIFPSILELLPSRLCWLIIIIF